MHRDWQSLRRGPLRDGAVERTADGIRRMGRDADPYTIAGELGQLVHAFLQTRQARLAIAWVRAEDFLIDDP